MSNQKVEEVRLLFQNNPRLSICRALTVLQMPRTTVHRIWRKDPHLFPYRTQNWHLMQQIDKQHRLQFHEYCQNHQYGYSEYSLELCLRKNAYFSTKGMFVRKTSGFRGQSEQMKEIQYPRVVLVLFSGVVYQKNKQLPRIKSRIGL